MDKLVKNKGGTILTFGELLLRMIPDAKGDWLAKNSLPFFVGGAELNVAAALALWGLPARYVTALPDNSMSAQLVDYIQKKGIDTNSIYYHGSRVGLYFLTKGNDLKHDALIYDRANSAFAELKPGLVDWDKALDGVSWFHFSAICPAVSASVAEVCEEVLEVASKKGITISIDLNYRAKLWQYGKTPLQIMPELMPYCDVVMGNIWSTETMLGIPVSPGINKTSQKEEYLQQAKKTSQEIIKAYPKCKAVANTFRFDDHAIKYYTTLYANDKFYHSHEYDAETVIDKVGSGDCFMAGLIYGFYQGHQPAELLEFATAAAFQKLFVESDATNKSVDEIKSTIKYEQAK